MKVFFEAADVLTCIPTGFGKSEILSNRILISCQPQLSVPKDPIVVVCSPLVHGPHEGTVQVDGLLNKGVSAVFLGDDNGFDEDIVRGSFTFVYGSPETLVAKPMRRSVLSSDVYVSRVVAVTGFLRCGSVLTADGDRWRSRLECTTDVVSACRSSR